MASMDVMAQAGAERLWQDGNVNTLPYFTTSSTIPSIIQSLGLLNSQWRSILNPVLGIPILSGVQLTNIPLVTGVNVINTTLQRQQQGWFITDIDAAISLYRSAPFNSLTLNLTASAPATVSLWVY
jgi:hypothetical protein